MQDLTFAIETLKWEHAERLARIERERLAREMEARNKQPGLLRDKLGDLLILAGRRLQAYSGVSAHPLEHADSGVAR
ncbi:MAG: hypothetical protein R2873_29975 [Caldilineaceae bacterium]|nr:hypothetical protein [Caldilineaceae bacterium]